MGRMRSRFCRRPPCGDSQPMAQRGACFVCRRTSGGVQIDPHGPAFYGYSARDGPDAPWRVAGERASLSRLLHQGSGPSVRRAMLPNRGVRERPYAMAGCPRLRKARSRSAADTVRIDAGERWHSTTLLVQAASLRLGSRDCVAVKLLSTQIVRKQAKAICHCQQCRTLHAASSSTLSNSTNGWLTWQRRS